jgi:hypothetical protein
MTANGAKQHPFRAETAILGAILAIGLVHALLYVYLVPPWQHYDEPNHFEIVWLTAKLGRHPKEEDIDPQLSRSVVQSRPRTFPQGQLWGSRVIDSSMSRRCIIS